MSMDIKFSTSNRLDYRRLYNSVPLLGRHTPPRRPTPLAFLNMNDLFFPPPEPTGQVPNRTS